MQQPALLEELRLRPLARTGRTKQYEARYWRNPSYERIISCASI